MDDDTVPYDSYCRVVYFAVGRGERYALMDNVPKVHDVHRNGHDRPRNTGDLS